MKRVKTKIESSIYILKMFFKGVVKKIGLTYTNRLKIPVRFWTFLKTTQKQDSRVRQKLKK